MRSVRGRMVLAVVAMAAILSVLAYAVSVQHSALNEDLQALHGVQEVKSHVLIPQKDMTEFLAKLEAATMWVEHGFPEVAQEAFDSSAEAEQYISEEFELLEKMAPEDFLPVVEKTHQDWEVATEFLKIQAEATAAEAKVELKRPSTSKKVVDEHTEKGTATARAKYGKLDAEALTAIAMDAKASPVTVADKDMEIAADKADDLLMSYQDKGDASLRRTQRLTLFGLLAALVGVVGVGAMSTFSIVGPLKKLEDGAGKIAGGDLEYQFGPVYTSEIAVVTKAVQDMAHSLKARIQNLEEVAGVVVLTSEEIAEQAGRGDAADLGVIVQKADMMKGLVSQALPGAAQQAASKEPAA